MAEDHIKTGLLSLSAEITVADITQPLLGNIAGFFVKIVGKEGGGLQPGLQLWSIDEDAYPLLCIFALSPALFVWYCPIIGPRISISAGEHLRPNCQQNSSIYLTESSGNTLQYETRRLGDAQHALRTPLQYRQSGHLQQKL